MTTTSIGRRAERLVALYMRSEGYLLLAMNWRTRSCEIDVIAFKNNCVYFVEVKYRSSERNGTGLEYITPTKLRQMNYAAYLWSVKNQWDGAVMLCAAAVNDANHVKLIEIID